MTFKNTFHWDLNENTKLFIQENAFENVVNEMAAILFGGGRGGGHERSDAKVSDRYLTDVVPKVFTIWVVFWVW